MLHPKHSHGSDITSSYYMSYIKTLSQFFYCRNQWGLPGLTGFTDTVKLDMVSCKLKAFSHLVGEIEIEILKDINDLIALKADEMMVWRHIRVIPLFAGIDRQFLYTFLLLQRLKGVVYSGKRHGGELL